MHKFLLLLAACAGLSLTCQSQDQSTSADQQASAPAPSLGDIARQVRLKKQQKEAQLQQAKATQPKTEIQNADAKADAQVIKPARIVTNDESSDASVTSAVEHATTSAASDSPTGHEDRNAKASKWKSDILAQKGAIASMEQEMKALSDTIHFAGANCVANCAQWNERQQEKQQQVESMKAQLQDLQKHLEEMQESARKEGFGGTVYDPSE